jgi:hypothetical protein
MKAPFQILSGPADIIKGRKDRDLTMDDNKPEEVATEGAGPDMPQALSPKKIRSRKFKILIACVLVMLLAVGGTVFGLAMTPGNGEAAKAAYKQKIANYNEELVQAEKDAMQTMENSFGHVDDSAMNRAKQSFSTIRSIAVEAEGMNPPKGYEGINNQWIEAMQAEADAMDDFLNWSLVDGGTKLKKAGDLIATVFNELGINADAASGSGSSQ